MKLLLSGQRIVAAAWLITAIAFAADPATMTHGPILGRPATDSIAVWARTSQPARFVVHFGTTPERLAQKAASEPTGIAHDNTGFVILRGLQPNTKYHYRVSVDDLPQGQPGSFRTLPTAARTEHNPRGLYNFRFEVGSCANQNPQHGIGHALPTYTTMLRELRDNIHFAIMNGDWLYEEMREHSPEAWRTAHGLASDRIPRIVQLAPTIVGVWENYKLYLSRAPNLSAWHRHVPSVFTFDDHELVNDIWGAGTAGHRHRRTVFRDIGTQAWHDYLGWASPSAHSHAIHFGLGRFEAGSDLLVDPNADFTRMPLGEMANLHVHWGKPTDGVNEMKYDDDSGRPNARVYDIAGVVNKTTLRIRPPARSTEANPYSIGRRNYGSFRVANCEFFLLDTRSHRDFHDTRRPAEPGRSMLGRAQYEWLVGAMRASDADFFFVVSSVPFTIPHSGAGGFEFDTTNKEEAWVVFLDEREKLIRLWDSLQRPVFVLTGDLHNSFAIKVSDRVWEFCSGPHNSVNHVPKLDEGNRPATGQFKSGARECDIYWSSYILDDVPRLQRLYPFYCVVQVNNVFNSPPELGGERWVAFPDPQVIFQYFDGWTGELRYAQSVTRR